MIFLVVVWVFAHRSSVDSTKNKEDQTMSVSHNTKKSKIFLTSNQCEETRSRFPEGTKRSNNNNNKNNKQHVKNTRDTDRNEISTASHVQHLLTEHSMQELPEPQPHVHPSSPAVAVPEEQKYKSPSMVLNLSEACPVPPARHIPAILLKVSAKSCLL
jgi:hypothetical protein